MAMRGGSLASDYPVYWERQGQDKLCAIHTLNTLLQQPVFSEIELAQIAQRLDREEASLLGTSRGSSSHNVDADGNFSLPVMEGALNTRNWCLVNLDKPEIRHAVLGNPQRETAYVCNSHRRAHWYTIRKVHSKWYDLDSLKPGPTFISDQDLLKFLEKTMSDGFTVFVIREAFSDAIGSAAAAQPPQLPGPDKFLHGQSLQTHQMYVNDREMESLWDAYRAKQDKEMTDAQRVAGEGGEGGGSSSFGQVIDPRKKAPETDWSKLGAGNTLGGGSGGSSGSAIQNPAEPIDDDLAAAIAASMVPPPPPEPTSGGLQLSIKYSADEPLKYSFAPDATVSQVFQPMQKNLPQTLEYMNMEKGFFPSLGTKLICQGKYALMKKDFPKSKKFLKDNQSIGLDGADVTFMELKACGFGGRELLMLQLE